MILHLTNHLTRRELLERADRLRIAGQAQLRHELCAIYQRQCFALATAAAQR